MLNLRKLLQSLLRDLQKALHSDHLTPIAWQPAKAGSKEIELLPWRY